MRLLHLADLHIGKRVNGYNMLEDQRFAFAEILKLIDREDVQAILLSGDIYDLSNPSTEAMTLFDDLLNAFSNRDLAVFIIAGNHDSAARLAFAKNLVKSHQIHISRPFDGQVEKITLEDDYGDLHIYLLPFIKPIYVKSKLPDLALGDFQTALSCVLSGIDIDEEARNIILSHQFITGAETSESEELYVGGTEAISLGLYDKFDYVAMGHIHKKQAFRKGQVRYPGSLLKYSKSEANYNKAITIVDIREKGNITVEEHKINYLRDMRLIEGNFDNIMKNAHFDENRDDYIHVNLFDKEEILDAMSRLRDLYPNIMSLVYTRRELKENLSVGVAKKVDQKDPLTLFKEFYESKRNQALDEEKEALMADFIQAVWGKK